MSRKRLFEIIEASQDDDRVSYVYDCFMMAVIVISLVPLAFKSELRIFRISEIVCAVIFVIDYLLRWATADYKFARKSIWSFVRYPFSFMALVDLFSILPTFLMINSSFKALRILRMARTFRIFRVFKAVRYSKSIHIIMKVLERSRDALIAVSTLAIAYILVCALIIFNVEPDSFKNFFDAIYWSTVSLTTVGYGDISPVSTWGRFITMVSAFVGIAVIALPSGIITAGYMKELSEEEDEDE